MTRADVLAAYWYVTISHLIRGRISVADLMKSAGISLLIMLIWPYVLIRWLWCLLNGNLTREVILDPIDGAANQRVRDPDENS